MLDIQKLKRKDFEALALVVQQKMKLGLIDNEHYLQSTWVTDEKGDKLKVYGGSFSDVKHVCGCTACIGGWMALEAGLLKSTDVHQFVERAVTVGKMSDLFQGYPLGGEKTPTTRQACRAIQNYFDGSKEPWQRVGRA